MDSNGYQSDLDVFKTTIPLCREAWPQEIIATVSKNIAEILIATVVSAFM